MTTTNLFAGLNQEATQQAVYTVLQALGQDSSLQGLRSDTQALGTQTTSAAILAKITASAATAALQNSIIALLGLSTGGYAKLEDAASASGDRGVFMLGVRAPATPIALTDAAGDYGALLISAEGKQIVALNAPADQNWQAAIVATTAAATAIKATPGATLKTYLSDLDINLAAAVSGGLTVTIQDSAATPVVLARHTFAGTLGETWSPTFRVPKGTSAVNLALNIVMSAAASVNVNAAGHTAI